MILNYAKGVNGTATALSPGRALPPQVAGDLCQEGPDVVVEHGCRAEPGEPLTIDGHVIGVADGELPVDHLDPNEGLPVVLPVPIDCEPMRSHGRGFGILGYEAERDIAERRHGAHPVQLGERQLRRAGAPAESALSDKELELPVLVEEDLLPAHPCSNGTGVVLSPDDIGEREDPSRVLGSLQQTWHEARLEVADPPRIRLQGPHLGLELRESVTESHPPSFNLG